MQDDIDDYKSNKFKFNRWMIFVAAGGVIVVLAAGVIGVYFNQRKSVVAETKSEQEVIIESVSKLVQLPSEEPTIATVTDSTTLKSNQQTQFFHKAENGDKVILFSQAKKAILYRPSSEKIVEITSVDSEEASAQAQINPDKPSAYSFVIYNGTTINGLAAKMEEQLKVINPENSILKKGNAVDSSYQESILVDLTSVNSTDAQKIATTLGVKVGTLPDNETKPLGAQFLVIVGTDRAP